MSATIQAPAQADASAHADLLTVARRPSAYRVEPKAKRGSTGENSYVTRGVHAKTGAPALVHVDGSTVTGTPLGVVGAAILNGVITDAEIDYLKGLRDQ